MNPVYFPFTHSSDPVLKSVADFLGPVTVYLPSELDLPGSEQKGCDDHPFLRFRIPVKGDEAEFGHILKQYRAWADLHQAGGLSHYKSAGDAIPFFGDTSITAIRQDIRRGDTAKSDTGDGESLQAARVFLHMARVMDEQNREVQGDLEQLRRLEADLFEDLKGEKSGEPLWELPNDPSTDGEDPGSYLPEIRLAAWSRLFLIQPDPAPLFVTTSPAIFNFISDRLDEQAVSYFVSARDVQKEKVRSEEGQGVKELFDRVAAGNWTDATQDHLEMTNRGKSETEKGFMILVVSTLSSFEILARFLSKDPVPSVMQKRRPGDQKTLFTLLCS